MMGRSGYDITDLALEDEPETPQSLYSPSTPRIEETHPLYYLVDLLTGVMMEAYKQAVAQKRKHPGDALNRLAEGYQPLHGKEEPVGPLPKRSRPSETVANSAEEKQGQRAATRRAQDRRFLLACPFAKKDPAQYRDCHRFFLKRIRDVKQHLSRCHRKPIYCPICKDTFDDEGVRDVHTQSQKCIPRPSVAIQGITEVQKKELSQRVSPKMTEQEQWFTVFDILFSPHPRPRTPYRDRELSTDLCVFQDFMTIRGPTIVAGFLRSKGVFGEVDERGLLSLRETVLAEGLQLIVEQWVNDSAATAGASDEPGSPSATQSLDSGIGMQHGSSTESTTSYLGHVDLERHEETHSNGNLYTTSSPPHEESEHPLGAAGDGKQTPEVVPDADFDILPNFEDSFMLVMPAEQLHPFDFDMDWPT